MFWINERIRFIKELLDLKSLAQLRCVAMADREEIGKEITALKAKRRKLVLEGEKLLNQE